MYDQLNLKAWPFQVVPDEEFAKIWAGRKQTKLQIDQLVRKLQLAPKSNLHLLWANFGMGKTHTLLHLRYLCQQTRNQLIPIYAAMPNRPTGFVDVYRVIVSAFPFDYLADQLVKVGNSTSGGLAQNPLFSSCPGVVNALLAYRSGDLERMVAARQWLIAQPGLTGHDLHSIGVTSRIRTSEDAINSLTALTRLCTYGARTPARVVILIDEYQRIGELRPAPRNEINAGIRAYLNANPKGLEIMLTFAFGNPDNVYFLISNELRNVASPERINLEVLTKEQAVEFISELLSQFRLYPDERWAFPFSPQSITRIINEIANKKILTPRLIMQMANHVLETYLINQGSDQPGEITLLDTVEILKNVDLDNLDDGE